MSLIVKLTMNRRAVEVFWPQGVSAMQMRLEEKQVLFQPIQHEHERLSDVANAQQKARGGIEFTFAGPNGRLLSDLLTAEASPSRPYFLLSRAYDGWIKPLHYDRDGDPPRTLPSMRMWVPRPSLRTSEASAADPAAGYAETVRSASAVLLEWRGGRRPGRTPTAINEAQRIMDEFNALVHEVRPNLLLVEAVDLDAIRGARDALSKVIDEAEKRKQSDV